MVETLDPDRLASFVAEMEGAGFVAAESTPATWQGPIPASLQPHTAATTMRVVIHDGWPYVQPSIYVEGIRWWHAAREAVCLWQEGDNSKEWVTFDGILRRLDTWVSKAEAGFVDRDGAALDPHLYYAPYDAMLIGVDVEGLIGKLDQDGQHGKIHLDDTVGDLPVIAAGHHVEHMPGHWFFRSRLNAPPTSLEEFLAALTDKQRRLFTAQMLRSRAGVFVLAWPTPHGVVSLIVGVSDQDGGRIDAAARPTPISQADRLRRAGPDGAALRRLRVVVIGVGAVGSHLAITLARSGIGHLTIVDGDVMTPTITIRHASPATGVSKVDAVEALVRPFDWTQVTKHNETPRTPSAIRRIIADADLCIDATGSSLIAELVSRVAATSRIPMMSVALYRGGRVIRVRRQAENDTPLVERLGRWHYPEIPAAEDDPFDFVGVETGCVAPIHNAPPSAVLSAAALAARVAIDQLTGRREEPDEVLEVLSPLDTPPFERRGRLIVSPPRVMLTDAARTTLIAAARSSKPEETGGILIGVIDERAQPCVIETVEIPSEHPSPLAYRVPEGATAPIIDAARTRDRRLGYLGEWHSHPSNQPASATDVATMLKLAAMPDVRHPVLVVARPTGDGFELDALVTIDGALVATSLVGLGPLAEEDAT